MAKEYLSNLPVPGSVTPISTLEAELKTGETKAKLVTALPVGFRTEGIQFRLICGSEILLVTKVEESGKKITVTRAAEESSEANHASGASLYNFITKGALEKSGEEREKTYTAKAPLELTGSEFEIKAGGITESYLGSEAVTNAKVKKESLEPNRLEKEKLTSTQIKPEGIVTASLAGEAVTGVKIATEGITNTNVKKESLAPTALEKEKLTSEQIKAKGIKAVSLANEEITSTQIKGRGIEPKSLAIPWKAPVALASAELELAAHYTVSGESLISVNKELLKIDEVETTVGMRVLLLSESAKDDGIYEVIKTGKASTEKWELKRTTDANTTAELQDAVTVVEEGSVNKGSQWTQTATVTTVGTTPQVWTGDIGPVTTVAIYYRKEPLKMKKDSFTNVEVDTVIKDPGSNFAAKKGYKVPANGYYLVALTVGAEIPNLTYFGATIFVSGNEAGIDYHYIVDASEAFSSTSTIVFAKAGEIIEPYGFQNSATEPNFIPGVERSRFTVVRVA